MLEALCGVMMEKRQDNAETQENFFDGLSENVFFP
jgi:hypothetical protein